MGSIHVILLGLGVAFVTVVCTTAGFRTHALSRAIGIGGVTKKELDPAMLQAVAELGGPVDREIATARVANDEGALSLALIDADRELDAYPRLPRVLASISSSGSLLLAAASLRSALRTAEDLGWEALTTPLTIVSMGIFGTVWCLSLQGEYAKLRGEARAQVDRLAGV